MVFVEQDVRCEAERVVQLICCSVDVGAGVDGRGRDVADERGPLVVFRVVYDPPLAGGGMRMRTGNGE
jgi:hypothetical protein